MFALVALAVALFVPLVCGSCIDRDSLRTHELFACLEREVPAQERFRFVQIGANDGVMMDPLHDVMKTSAIRNRKWVGVFVEPLPVMMRKLKENKLSVLGPDRIGYVSAVINATCPPGGIVPFFKYVRSANEPVWNQGLGSLSIPLGRDPRRFKRVPVACKTPRELAESVISNGAADPHILLIDTEGFDIEILLAIAASKWPFGRPTVIAFEVWEGKGKLRPDAIADMYKMFATEGFRVRKSAPGSEDYLAFNCPFRNRID